MSLPEDGAHALALAVNFIPGLAFVSSWIWSYIFKFMPVQYFSSLLFIFTRKGMDWKLGDLVSLSCKTLDRSFNS